MPGSWFDENNISDWHADENVQNGGFSGGWGGPLYGGASPGGAGGDVAGAPGAELPQAGPMSPEGNPQAAAFDPRAQVGHNGTLSNGMNREAYRDAWMSSGVNSVAGMKDWIGKNGGTWMADNGTVMTPFGEALDMGGNAKGSAAGHGVLSTQWGGGGGPAGPGGGGMPMSGDGQAFAAGGGGGAWSMPGGGGGAAPTYSGPDYVSSTIKGPTEYNPQATAGPERFTPQQIKAQQIQGPEAIRAQAIGDAGGFSGVTDADMKADPGYKFRLNESLGALQSSAAAKGALRSFNTLDAVTARAGDMASQEYANVYGRKSDEYKTGLQDRFQVGQANNQNAFTAYDLSNRYDQTAKLANQSTDMQAQGQNANNNLAAWQAYQGMNQQNAQFNAGRTDTANQNNFTNRFAVDQANNANSLAGWQANTNAKLGFGSLDNQRTQTANAFSLGQGGLALGNRQADQSYDLGKRNVDLGYYSAGNQFALGQGQLGLGWAGYGLNADQQNFNQSYSLADMGMRAAGQQGAYGGAYANASGNNATDAGAAAAGGRVGSSNAWANGFTGAYNAAGTAAGQYLGQKPSYYAAQKGTY